MASSELTATVEVDTGDSAERLREVRDAAKEARVELWKLNNALAHLEEGRESTTGLMD